ncbi:MULTISPECIES: phospholipase D-like domain-containing protein [unclassified Mycolicibacterium]|uniref:phospholipase D-like domain-containing protein n=1 Tax=unclassified Mycolicibacterium TaxID=2636767 RepID=UPI00224ABB8B|nr:MULTISPECIES: phospholipase D-like domain-containing protein [unclassified Mycolicibacterium]MCX2711868.1 phospholipase D-like domain-containing protein [Mycolicibacterium sp. J2]MDX1872664.1 phospholipase D-like domain-containing protein [Mycolicibacterium sp. 120266]
MTRSLIILPDDSAQPVLDAIHASTRSVRIKMFAFSHRPLLDAVVAAHRRGVDVKVMLNPERRDGETDNDAAREMLQRFGIEVRESNPAFDLTHEKSMVVDDEHAFVESLNWTEENFTLTRDYAVVTPSAYEVAEIIDCFEADWAREDFDPGTGAHLIWCPSNGRHRIADFIDSAKHTLFLQNERYQDPVIIERLVRAARRGVKVHVMARAAHHLKDGKLVEGVSGMRILDDVGIKIHRLKHMKLHAKMILADHERAVVGSINFSPGSFDHRRELAIEVTDHEITKRLNEVAHQDWKHSAPMDLSDAGLIADLAGRGRDAHDIDQLALHDPDA